MSEIRRLVRQHDRLLHEIAANTRHIRTSHGIDAPESILGTDEPSQSIFSQLIEKTNDTEAEFETIILGTKVYSNAFAGVLETTSSNDDQSNDVQTIIDAETSSSTHSTCLEDLRVILLTLEPQDIVFRSWSEFDLAKVFNPVNGSSTKREVAIRIYDMRKLTNSRYEGYKWLKSQGILGPARQLNRSTVLPKVLLRTPITVSIIRESRRGYHYKKGESFMCNVSPYF